ncbi:MAG: hypothetical protein R3E85_07535 [Planctomycetota bacterium]
MYLLIAVVIDFGRLFFSAHAVQGRGPCHRTRLAWPSAGMT